MNFKATMGICRKIESEDKMVILPQEIDELVENQLVVVISSEEFIRITENFKDRFEFMESVKKEIQAEK